MKKEKVCATCKYLEFSDMYGICGEAHKGIVRPNDTCPYWEAKAEDEIEVAK